MGSIEPGKEIFVDPQQNLVEDSVKGTSNQISQINLIFRQGIRLFAEKEKLL